MYNTIDKIGILIYAFRALLFHAQLGEDCTEKSETDRTLAYTMPVEHGHCLLDGPKL